MPAMIPLLRTGHLSAIMLVVSLATALAQGGPPVPQVGVVQPVQRTITIWDEYTGRFEAKEQVEVRPRVSGFVEQVHFRDGQTVAKGDLLFSIEERLFQLAVEAARADVARTRAQVALAENEVERAEGLIRNQTITARDVDTRRANLAVARAAQQASEANLKSAELNLEWTKVKAPIAGRISDRKVDPGNLVTGGAGGATLLTTIVGIDPIHLTFDASEADYLRYTRLLFSGAWPFCLDKPKPVMARLADETEWKHEGKMDFVDNVLNARSGTIRGRAIFQNANAFFTPGTFARMRLFGGTMEALLVPDQAVVSDQAAKIVLTVNAENTVVPKRVTLGGLDGGLRVIREGLQPGDRVIVTGIANPMVRPGTKVNAQAAPAR
jgi:membrane fusion protein, multidrug efflux system